MTEAHTLLGEPPPDDQVDAAFRAVRESEGYVMNLTRLWVWRPDLLRDFAALRATLMAESTLGDRDFAVLVAATASELGDSYCSLAWGARLARLSDPATAAAVLTGSEATALSERERALAAWARAVVRDPNATTAADVERLKQAGLDEREIFEATAFVAFRLAFSTVNDALGAHPDHELATSVPDEVRAAVTFGRAPAVRPSA